MMVGCRISWSLKAGLTTGVGIRVQGIAVLDATSVGRVGWRLEVVMFVWIACFGMNFCGFALVFGKQAPTGALGRFVFGFHQ